MTTSASDRAKALFPLAFGETLSPEQSSFRDRIAAAITQAENEKLEEAAAAAAGMVLKAIDDGSPRGQIAAGVAFAVRSLKTPKD